MARRATCGRVHVAASPQKGYCARYAHSSQETDRLSAARRAGNHIRAAGNGYCRGAPRRRWASRPLCLFSGLRPFVGTSRNGPDQMDDDFAEGLEFPPNRFFAF